MDAAQVAITQLGSVWVAGPVAAAVCLALVLRGRRAAAQAFAAAIGIAVAVTAGLKPVFAAWGPIDVGTVTLLGRYAPSGHAVLAVSVYGGLAVVMRRLARGPGAGALALLAALAAVIVILGVLATRITLDAHEVGDLMLGAGIGAAALGCILLVPRDQAPPEFLALLLAVAGAVALVGVVVVPAPPQLF